MYIIHVCVIGTHMFIPLGVNMTSKIKEWELRYQGMGTPVRRRPSSIPSLPPCLAGRGEGDDDRMTHLFIIYLSSILYYNILYYVLYTL